VHGLGGPPGEDECTDATELMTELDEDEVEEDVPGRTAAKERVVTMQRR